MDQKRISIIIPILPTARSLKSVRRTIESCLSQFELPEIIVTTNLPSKELKAICLNANALYFEAPSIGVNIARNYGAQKAAGDFLYFLDDDCVLENADHLSRIIELMKKNSNIDAIGGGYVSSCESGWIADGYNATCNQWVLITQCRVEQEKNIITVSRLLGGNFCIRKTIFLKSMFNEKYTSGADESEFFSRRNDLKLTFSSDFNVIHFCDESVKTLISRAQKQSKNYLGKKHSPNLQRKLSSAINLIMAHPRGIFFYLLHFGIFFFHINRNPKSSPNA